MISKISGCPWWWEDGHENKVIGVVVSVVVAVLVASWYVIRRSRCNRELQLPPGPRGLPLVGNLLSLEADLHVYFAKLAKVYGPIMKLQMGRKCCVVVSSSSLAKEVLRDQDATFANRDALISTLVFTYGGIDIVWSPSNPEWRTLRKICTQELLSHTNLDSCYALRRKEVRQTVRDLYHHKIDTPVNVGVQVFVTILNVMMSMLWGGTLQGEERTRVGGEFQQMFNAMIEVASKPNVSDLFPVLRWFDIQGIERQSKMLLGWMERIFDSVIDQHMKMDKANQAHKESKDFLQCLLKLVEQQDAKTHITMTQLKALLMDMVVAGTDTTSTTLEWVMAEMMQKPETMRKAQEELKEVVGMNNMVEESHLSKLQYLDAVVKETLRLHPPGPLLIPRRPSSSSTIGGYTVPKVATVFCNVWEMHRDPEVWDEPLDFQPERFLTSDLEKYDYRGNNFNYLPFGSGRRVCVGIPLAERMITYVLASLLHSFEWRLPEGTKLDLTEKFGIVLRKSTPLVAIPTPRLLNLELYN
ncbi:Cytochrome P450 [Macleaya cordata]|uniref:Cytochrome P450 n=1 Tax=Macleaya cordata TaxID=56857 RepID=A0A200QB17_MACCD|nr:Cytochrome P450 [Macleaya cordata]